MYTCSHCDLFFDEAHEAFQHLAINHADDPHEKQIVLDAMFDWQFAHYETIPIAYLE
jgi:hypothetical protein